MGNENEWISNRILIEVYGKIFRRKVENLSKIESRNFCLFTFCSWADPLNICRPAGEASRINMNFYQFDTNTQTSKFNPEYSRAQSTEENLVSENKSSTKWELQAFQIGSEKIKINALIA